VEEKIKELLVEAIRQLSMKKRRKVRALARNIGIPESTVQRHIEIWTGTQTPWSQHSRPKFNLMDWATLCLKSLQKQFRTFFQQLLWFDQSRRKVVLHDRRESKNDPFSGWRYTAQDSQVQEDILFSYIMCAPIPFIDVKKLVLDALFIGWALYFGTSLFSALGLIFWDGGSIFYEKGRP